MSELSRVLVGLPRRGVVAAAVLSVVALSACSSNAGTEPQNSSPPEPPRPIVIAGSVVTTAGSTDETDIVIPDPIKASWATLGGKASGLEWIQVDGDTASTAAPVDLASGSDAATAKLVADANAQAATSPERSALAGLDALKSPAKTPVWVFSPLLDNTGPLDFNQLAFDESPNTVIKEAKKDGDLPNLKDRDVTFVVTPVAGQQKKLSDLQIGYQRAIWEGMAKSAGAKKVTFYVGTGTTARTGTITPIEVPDPNDSINSQTEGKTSTCTLPAPALFVSDQATLIDKKATLKALKACVGKVENATQITVEGHTANVSGADNSFTKSLSTRRATEVAALLKELDVPAKNIVKVVGYGGSKPLVQPSSNPKNRAVVVRFTTTG